MKLAKIKNTNVLKSNVMRVDHQVNEEDLETVRTIFDCYCTAQSLVNCKQEIKRKM